MAREKFRTLTEQMFYVLLCLQEERCGAEVMDAVRELTGGRVRVGPGTLYNLLEQFLAAGMIEERTAGGRKRNYCLAAPGREALEREYRRMERLTEDYRRCYSCVKTKE